MPVLVRSMSCLSLLPMLFALAVQAQSDRAPHLFEQISRHLGQQERTLIDIRHDLHRHPELSNEEVRTAGVITAHLEGLGFEVRTGVGGHGVVGMLKSAQPGPVVAFRADMDAVRSNAPDPVNYRSVVPGMRHICGHDVHVAVGLGIAEAFAATRDEWPGTVMLIFQPAEERGTGANAMLRDNVFEPMPPDAIFAVHTTPYPVGTLATAPGAMMAGRALVNVTLQGPGNVEEAAATVRQALLSLSTVPPNQMMDTAPPGFIFVQLFNPALSASSEDAGSSSEATVGGQVMTLGAEDRARAKALALEALQSADLGDATLEVTYNDRFLEGVTNDSALVELANAAIETHVPSVDVQKVDGAIPVFSEDFGSFQARTPGIMYYLGVSNPEAGTVGMPHTPNYVADDAAILVGSRAITAAMLERLMAE